MNSTSKFNALWEKIFYFKSLHQFYFYFEVEELM